MQSAATCILIGQESKENLIISKAKFPLGINFLQIRTGRKVSFVIMSPESESDVMITRETFLFIPVRRKSILSGNRPLERTKS